MKRHTLDELLRARSEKQPVALVCDLKTGLQSLVYPEVIQGDLGIAEPMLSDVRAMLRTDRSGTLETPGGDPMFVRSFNPPLRLVLVGAVHISQALAPMAAMAGYGVTVVDPRSAFNTDARFPDVATRDDWPDEALEELAPDSRTAVVTLTHDPKIDDPALEVALRSEAFYIGCLGSKKTHGARLERMDQAGLGEAARARIHGPVGLDIGAKSPAEIAVAILAEITAARHGRDRPSAKS